MRSLRTLSTRALIFHACCSCHNCIMQASTSKAVLHASRPAHSHLLLSCTCRHASSTAPSTARPSLVEVLSQQKGGPFGLADSQQGEAASPRSYHPKSQRARLIAAEKRRTVIVNGLSPSVTPGDIRRLANSKVRNPQSVLEST